MAKKKEDRPAELPSFIKFRNPDGTPPVSVHRRDISNAPYNPRFMQHVSREKLTKNLKTVGLVNALVVNRRPGSDGGYIMLSGNMRLGIMDRLMRTDNYLVPVNVVEMSEKEEKQQLVFMNVKDSQGDFDEKLLRELIADPVFDSEAAGFDLSEVVERFGEDTLVASSEKLQALSEALEAAKARNEDIKKKSSTGNRTDFFRVCVFKDAADAEKLSAFNEEFGCVFLHGGRLLQRLTGHGKEAGTQNDE